MSVLPAVDSLITEYELKETLGKYQFADKYLKLGLLALLILIAPGVSALFDLVSNILTVPDGVIVSLIFICELASFVFLLGVYMRVRSRWKEWQEIMHREVLLEKIEYFAKATSSTIIAQILVDIEKTKETQKQESDKARAHSTMQSVLQTENMKVFEEMMDKREEKNKWKSLSIHAMSFLAGYLSEKGLDKILFSANSASLFVR